MVCGGGVATRTVPAVIQRGGCVMVVVVVVCGVWWWWWGWGGRGQNSSGGGGGGEQPLHGVNRRDAINPWSADLYGSLVWPFRRENGSFSMPLTICAEVHGPGSMVVRPKRETKQIVQIADRSDSGTQDEQERFNGLDERGGSSFIYLEDRQRR
jgi:hypothetical protein